MVRKTARGYDLITEKLFKQLPTIAITHMTPLFDAIVRLVCYFQAGKISEMDNLL